MPPENTTMAEDAARHPPSSPRAIACMEVWGGNQATRTNLALPGLAAWVCSAPFEGSSGGDVYYLSVCDPGVLSRVVLADVSGHGAGVSEAAVRLQSHMYRHINAWDQSEFVRDLGETLRRDGLETNYATAVTVSYYPSTRQLMFTNAGHPEPLWYRASADRWEFLTDEVAATAGTLSGLPLGLIPGTSYRQSAVSLDPGDIIILYTDSLIESETAAGEQVGRDRLLDFAKQAPIDSPAEAGESLVRRVRAFVAASAPTDDETIIVLQRSDTPERRRKPPLSQSENRLTRSPTASSISV